MATGGVHRSVGWTLVVPVLAALTACYPGSDAQVSQRHARERHQIATQGMRAATSQTTRGASLEGEALRQRVVERTWISEYPRLPNGQPGPYRLYDYFRQDGQFIQGHNWVYGEPVPVQGDAWRIEGARLCVLHKAMSHQTACYTVALGEREALQIYIDAPGTANHGLLTRVIRQTEAGPPRIAPTAR